MKRFKQDMAVTLIEMLIVTLLSVIVLGVIYLAYSNISSLAKVQQLESDFKKTNTVTMKEITSNLQESFANTAVVYNPASGANIDVSPVLYTSILYCPGSTTTHDTMGFYSSSGTNIQGSTLFKTFIRYGLKRLPKAPASFQGYALYKQVTKYTGATSPGSVDPNATSCRIIAGYYKNPKNYMAISKLDFQLRGNDNISVSMQLVGSISRGAGRSAKALYKPSDTQVYNTSVQLKLNSGSLQK